MKCRGLILFGAIATLIAVAAVPMVAQTQRPAATPAAQSYTPPRTAWGDPDLQGIWRFLQDVPLVRAEEFGGREFLTDAELAAKERFVEEFSANLKTGKAERRGNRELPLYNSQYRYVEDPSRPSRRTSAIIDPPDGRLPPWTLEGVKRYESREAVTRGRGSADSWEERALHERCIATVQPAELGNWGLGYSGRGEADWTLAHGTTERRTDVCSDRRGDTSGSASGGPGGTAGARPVRRIVQAPGYVVMLYEEDRGEYRIIPLTQRPVPKFRQWMGVDRGHWEGNTLVVETTNIKYTDGLIQPDPQGGLYPGSGETLRVIERYTRVNADTLELRYAIDDPETYTRPYTVRVELDRDDSFAISPALCHENNRDMGAILASARADEEAALGFAAEAADQRRPRFEEVKKEAEEVARQKR